MRCARSPSGAARRRSSSATAPASSPTPCCSAISTRRPGWPRPVTPGRRTSTARARDAADVVVNGPRATHAGAVAEVAAVTVEGAAALDDVVAKVAATGARAVRCRQRPGFIVEALLFPQLNDAVQVVDDG